MGMAPETEAPTVEKTGDVEILFTSDIHCGLQREFSVVGLQQIRETLEKKGVETLLVDNGDAVQGEALGGTVGSEYANPYGEGKIVIHGLE